MSVRPWGGEIEPGTESPRNSADPLRSISRPPATSLALESFRPPLRLQSQAAVMAERITHRPLPGERQDLNRFDVDQLPVPRGGAPHSPLDSHPVPGN